MFFYPLFLCFFYQIRIIVSVKVLLKKNKNKKNKLHSKIKIHFYSFYSKYIICP